MTGKKFDQGKPQWRQLPYDALEEVVKVLTYGANKYGSDDNWKHVEQPMDRYFDATMRHLVAYRTGELVDSETGISHLAHACADILFMLHFDKKWYD